MSEPWPCWTCKFRSALDTTGFYSCERPMTENVAIWERWILAPSARREHMLGTENQLRGETENDRPDCQVYEAGT